MWNSLKQRLDHSYIRIKDELGRAAFTRNLDDISLTRARTFVLCMKLLESIYTEVFIGSVYKYIKECSYSREYET